MMDIQELLTFIKVAETHSFSDAADALFITQPAVSKRIAALESNLNVKLFDRIGRQIHLTEAGTRLLPKAKRLANDLNDIKRSMTLQMDDVSGELNIATSHHIGLHRLPKTLKRFQLEYPQAEIKIEFTQSEDAHRQIIKGEAEIGIITLSSHSENMLNAIPIWSDPLQCVVSLDHPLAQLDDVDVIELSKYPCVLPHENTFTRQIAEKVFAVNNVRPQVKMNTNNLDTLAMLVSIGWGWSLIPSTVVNDQLAVVNLPALNVERKLGVIHHKQRTLSRAASAFIELLQAQSMNS
ncbi:HTH-type transcriptional regulator GltC [Marinomonas gallaica]|uniref:HTH-type transcriptional regulator GltC n=1 Tax=Marinomonas gallaica TaxID=1806667 RepID=A0A1C3JUC7_9GAMM|nr:LysR family transcriptional regulator [Marinomonas gallaica]SBT18838.1 HTH-type transcriptional regulator GltC [Marinomonas gallaica]SBT21793.1 HTH-type transcriptional regulator GltC [Marinomonas gallaica]